MENSFYLRVDECEDRCLYYIDCEKSSLGLYSKEHAGFVVRHMENGIIGLSLASHFDLGKPGLTAKPLKMMEHVPIGMDLSNGDSLLTFLSSKMSKYNIR